MARVSRAKWRERGGGDTLARFPGRCKQCPTPIVKGTAIMRHADGWVHTDCVEAKAEIERLDKALHRN